MPNRCVVHHMLLNGNASGVIIDDINDINDKALDENSILWSHIEYGRPGAYEWLIAQGLGELEAEALTRINTRPRMWSVGEALIILLRAINHNPNAEEEDMVSIRIWMTKGRIISARQRVVRSIQNIKSDLIEHHGPKTEGEFLIELIQYLADYIGETIDEIEEKILQYEGSFDQDSTAQSKLSALRRKTAIIRRFLAPQREALDALYRAPKTLLSDEERQHLHEQSDRVTRHVEDLDLVRERTLVLQEEIRNRIAEQQNSRTYLLSIVATIFLPLSFLTGVFGMNVAGLPGIEDNLAFIYVSIGMLIAGVGIMLFLRWKRWL